MKKTAFIILSYQQLLIKTHKIHKIWTNINININSKNNEDNFSNNNKNMLSSQFFIPKNSAKMNTIIIIFYIIS